MLAPPTPPPMTTHRAEPGSGWDAVTGVPAERYRPLPVRYSGGDGGRQPASLDSLVYTALDSTCGPVHHHATAPRRRWAGPPVAVLPALAHRPRVQGPG